MICFNFYFVMSVCLWRYALFDGSKEGETLQSSGFLAGITGSCQKSHLDSGPKLFLTAWPCLQTCKYFKAFIYNVPLGNGEELIQMRNPGHVNNMAKSLDIRAIFSFKRKYLVSSLCQQSLEASKLYAKFTKV